MTVREAIEKVTALNKHNFEKKTLIDWLSDVDGQMKEELFDNYILEQELAYKRYDADDDMDTELLVPDPYSELYIYYLLMQINYFSEETARYNNAAEIFNGLSNTFRCKFARTHNVKNRNDINWR